MTLKRKIYIGISWLLAILCMGVIFWMSSRVASESQAMSDSLLQKILENLGLEFTGFFIRKSAHALEFMGLSMLLFNAVYATFKTKLSPIIAFFATALYAVSDEIHQIFVEGRACQLRDMLIDSCGALAGVAVSLIILKIITIIVERRKRNGNTQTV